MTNELLKTKDVANAIGVSPSTILNWVKKYDVPHELNESGHYQFNDKQLSQLLDIQKRKEEEKEREKEEPVSTRYVGERLAKMEEKIKILETILSNKADDIVTFQLVEQRKTVRHIQSRLQKIEAQMEQWEKEQTKKEVEVTKEKPFLANLFSM